MQLGASLVPAAAVIPAPIAYIKVVAVKKLVVENLIAQVSSLWAGILTVIRLQTYVRSSPVGYVSKHFTLRKTECSRQVCPECISME